MSVKHLRFLKKALYKYKIISIKVGLFVLVGFCVFFPQMHLQTRSTHFGQDTVLLVLLRSYYFCDPKRFSRNTSHLCKVAFRACLRVSSARTLHLSVFI